MLTNEIEGLAMKSLPPSVLGGPTTSEWDQWFHAM